MNAEPLIRIQRLNKAFSQRGGLLGARSAVQAVRDVSLVVAHGETLGIVGESGCGKSTLGRMAVGLLEPSGGDVLIQGKPLYDRKAHRDYRAFRRGLAGTLQMVFQDPYSSLNPRMKVGESVAEPLRCSTAWRDRGQAGENDAGGKATEAAIREKAGSILLQVGLDADAAGRYPHEFSGGQRQRIAIARALVTRPAFVVCDEPTSSLDASVQSQVLNLLRDMQDDLGLTYLFISHDLAVVRHMSDRVAVMYQGLIVEEGGAEDVFSTPCHPYTRLLLDSVPGAAQERGDAPAETQGRPAVMPRDDGRGCPFAPRCDKVMEICGTSLPELARPPGIDGRLARCRLFDAP